METAFFYVVAFTAFMFILAVGAFITDYFLW